jgi:hypothetical protein
MNIYAQNGHKVVYLDENGYEGDRNYARDNGFVKGEVYEVNYTDVGGCHTSVYFHDMIGGHNSVMFEDYVEPTKQEPIERVFNEEDNHREPTEVVETTITYDDQNSHTYTLENSLGKQVTLSKSIDGESLIIRTQSDQVVVEINLIKNMFGLEDKPKIKIIEEKVLWGEPVFYQIDVPAHKALENIWYNRKHSVQVTPKNWNDFKNGDVNKFLY